MLGFVVVKLISKNLNGGEGESCCSVNGAISLIVFLSGYLNRRERLISHVHYLLHSPEDFRKSLIDF